MAEIRSENQNYVYVKVEFLTWLFYDIVKVLYSSGSPLAHHTFLEGIKEPQSEIEKVRHGGVKIVTTAGSIRKSISSLPIRKIRGGGEGETEKCREGAGR